MGARFSLALCMAIVALSSAHAEIADENLADYNRFVSRDLCYVRSNLEILGQSDLDKNQYLVLSARREPSQYVQCVFRLDENILCEAASFYYRNRRDAPKLYKLPQEKRKILERDGFTFRPRGNFYIEIQRPIDDDYEPIARFLLTILYEVYDMRFIDDLVIRRPSSIAAARVANICENPHITSHQVPTPISPGSK